MIRYCLLITLGLASCTPAHDPVPTGVWYIEDILGPNQCDNAKGLEIWLQENP